MCEGEKCLFMMVGEGQKGKNERVKAEQISVQIEISKL